MAEQHPARHLIYNSSPRATTRQFAYTAREVSDSSLRRRRRVAGNRVDWRVHSHPLEVPEFSGSHQSYTHPDSVVPP